MVSTILGRVMRTVIGVRLYGLTAAEEAHIAQYVAGVMRTGSLSAETTQIAVVSWEHCCITRLLSTVIGEHGIATAGATEGNNSLSPTWLPRCWPDDDFNTYYEIRVKKATLKISGIQRLQMGFQCPENDQVRPPETLGKSRCHVEAEAHNQSLLEYFRCRL